MLEQEHECKLEGCTKPSYSRGWCQLHYRRWHKHGTPTPPGVPALESGARRRTVNAGLCEVAECERAAWQRGMCQMHHTRWKKWGDPSVVKISKHAGRDACTWEGCNRTAKAKGFCDGHYISARYSAKREHMLPEEDRAPRCLYPGCQDPMYESGLCRNHEARAVRGSLGVPEENKRPLTGFGERMRLARVCKGWSLQKAGKEVGLTHERIRQLELRAKPPTEEWRIKSIADVFGVTVEWLVRESAEGSAS